MPVVLPAVSTTRAPGRRSPYSFAVTSAWSIISSTLPAAGIDAAALVLPTSTGNAARACAKYRRRRPIIALTHLPNVAEKLSLEWGVYPTMMQAAGTVDEMIDHALVVARDFADLPSGARVVLTAGRRTGTPGATNLVMVREIP